MALHAERLLASVSFRAPGLPASAVLCVRSLRDPSPRGLRLESAAVRAPPAWEDALEAALGSAAREAARPALEAVPAGAGAVLFGDRSELLACLAADWLRGEPRWWWVGLLGALPSRPAVARTWVEEPRYVPAALELLAGDWLATPFVRALEAREIARLSALLAAEFGLPWLAESVAAGPATAAEWPGPWVAVVPELADERLEPVRELFMGAALALRRAPVAVRGSEFARAARAWAAQGAGRATHGTDGPPPRAETDAPAGAAATEPGDEGDSPRLRTGQGRPDSVSAGPRPGGAGPGGDRPPDGDKPLADALLVGDDGTGELAPPTRRPSRSGARAGDQPSADTQTESSLPEAEHGPRAEAGELAAQDRESGLPVETELGGMFFLTGFALRLGLIPDFSAPERRGLGLHPWRLISELGRRLLTERPEDPVWELLDELAGDAAAVDEADSLSPWLDTVADYARARLAAALGVEGPEHVPDPLIRRRASVAVSAVHVDVLFAMDAHPIEIRLAGLDRDPGWLPAAGRHLRFVFE